MTKSTSAQTGRRTSDVQGTHKQHKKQGNTAKTRHTHTRTAGASRVTNQRQKCRPAVPAFYMPLPKAGDLGFDSRRSCESWDKGNLDKDKQIMHNAEEAPVACDCDSAHHPHSHSRLRLLLAPRSSFLQGEINLARMSKKTVFGSGSDAAGQPPPPPESRPP